MINPKNGNGQSDAGGIEATSRWLRSKATTPPDHIRKQEHPGGMQDPPQLPSIWIKQI
jgi:hypothetical protein